MVEDQVSAVLIELFMFGPNFWSLLIQILGFIVFSVQRIL
jgi:hypothetical protein